MTVLNVLLPLATSLLSLLFAALVLDQWRRRRHTFQLAWAAGLAWYAISAGTQAWGAALGWDSALYRAWYLFGAILVAAFLGLGTLHLLARTGFGHFAGVSIAIGGLFAPLSQLALIREGHPVAWSTVLLVVALAAGAGLALVVATAWRRDLAPHLATALLLAASATAAVLTLRAAPAAPGYAGALCLVFGALFSAYVYMPKRKVLRGGVRTPVLGQLHRALVVVVNLAASLPLAARALAAGRLSSRVPATMLIALGGFIPSLTSGLERFGVTWAFALGELLGVLCILAGFLVSEEVFRRLPFGARRAPRPATSG
jgi:hypothetical protein